MPPAAGADKGAPMASEGWLADLLGIKDVLLAGVASPRRSVLNFLGAVGIADNSGAQRLDLTIGAAARLVSTASGTISDLNTQSATIVEFTSASAKTVTSMVPTTLPVYLVNRGAGVLSIANNTGGTAANRIAPIANAQIDLAQGGTALCWYDTTSSRWLAVNVSGSSSSITMKGVSGSWGTNLLATAADAGIDGGTQFWVALVRVVKAQATSAFRFPLAHYDSTGKGWLLWCNNNANTSIQFRCANNTGTAFVDTPAYTIPSGEINQVQMFVGVHDTSTVALWASRAQQGSTSAITGYTATTSIATTIGSGPTGFGPDSEATIIAACGGQGFVPTSGELQAFYDAVKSTGRIGSGIAGKTTWGVDFSLDATTSSVPTTFDDRFGTEDMSFTSGSAASMTLETFTNPVFAW